jgi:hypothetical protein
MTSASVDINDLLKEARLTHHSARWLIYQRIAKDYGEGFARVVKAKVDEQETKRSKRKA